MMTTSINNEYYSDSSQYEIKLNLAISVSDGVIPKSSL